MQNFSVQDQNPNTGGSCLCSDERNADTTGPFIVFNATEMESNLDPYPVLCARCACNAAELVRDPLVREPAPKRSRRKQADEDGLQI